MPVRMLVLANKSSGSALKALIQPRGKSALTRRELHGGWSRQRCSSAPDPGYGGKELERATAAGLGFWEDDP